MNRFFSLKIMPFFFLLAFSFCLIPTIANAKNVNALYVSEDVMWFYTEKVYNRTPKFGGAGMTTNVRFLKTINEKNTTQYYVIISKFSIMPPKYYPYKKNATLVINGNEYSLAQMDRPEAIKMLNTDFRDTVFVIPDNAINQFSALSTDDVVSFNIPAASGLVINSFQLNKDNLDGMVKIISATKNDFSLYDEDAKQREKAGPIEVLKW
ncbi:MAG: hypothetical protein KBA38_04810 [Negativicutes bacterium]|nr:hypothetical protein [Negativicutes bacterium]